MIESKCSIVKPDPVNFYVLATILKSPQATEATISIVETFTKIRHLSRSIKELSTVQDKSEQKSLMQKSGELIAEILDDDLAMTDSETSIELCRFEVQAHSEAEKILSEQLNNSCLAPVHWKERLHDCATMRQTSPDPCFL